MEEKPSKKSFEELVDKDHKMYYSKAKWLIDNGHVDDNLDTLARQLYNAKWRA